jgi:integrase
MTRQLRAEDFLEERELKSLLAAARGRSHQHAGRDLVLLRLLAVTAIRPGEAAALKVEDLRLQGHKPWMRILRLKTRKEGGRLDDIPLTRSLARALQAEIRRRRLAAGDRVFPITVRAMEYLFATYAQLAKLTLPRRLYCLRHTALTRAWRESHDQVLVQRLAGHASPTTTSLYTHSDPERTREILDRTGSGL